MKKMYLLIVLGILIFFPISTNAEELDLERISDVNASLDVEFKEELEECKKEYKDLIQNNQIKLNSEGYIVVDKNDDLEMELIDDMNYMVKSGIAYFDGFTLRPRKNVKVDNFSFESEKISYAGVTSGFNLDRTWYSILRAYDISVNNKNELKRYTKAMSSSNPNVYASGMAAAISYWVGKVKPGGDWDYKVQNGYKPYNRKWTMYLKNSTPVKTTEWFGNYNYGFTGKLFFSKSVLLSASEVVSIQTSHTHDNAEDKAAISCGYGES